MRLLSLTILLVHLWCGASQARNPKDGFLARHAVPLAELRLEFADSIKIWGFGALHGSAKTEQAEMVLLEQLLEQHDSVWYFPEVDFSTAHYFEEYLRTDNDSLLRTLVTYYGMRVPQERTVEVYKKWQRLQELTRDKSLRIVGVDPIASPFFALQYLLELVRDEQWIYRKPLLNLLDRNAMVSREEYEDLIDEIGKDYAARWEYYTQNAVDAQALDYVLGDLQRLGESRGKAIVRNYRELNARYHFRRHPQFVRMGVGHILKQQQDGWSSFFAQLVQQGDYRREEIYTVQGFLTRSRVVWDEKYDDEGSYAGFTTKGGWGISDCWRERFLGIRYLKHNRHGDMTFFNLREAGSPYARAECLDLVVCRRPFGRREKCPSGSSTLDYIDAAILIRNSPASRPIYELDENE